MREIAFLSAVSLGAVPIVFGYIEAMRLPWFVPYGLVLPFALLFASRVL